MKLATLCYVRHNRHTLMMLRNKKADDIHEGKWNGLGGKFDPGETPEACARREILEESGLHAEALQMRGFITFPIFKDHEDWYVFVFTATAATRELGDCAEGELRWIPDEELLDLNLWPGDRVFIPWLDQDRFFSGRFSYVNKALVSHDVVFYD
jgi:8-oxo-dGTP diphosphatase